MFHQEDTKHGHETNRIGNYNVTAESSHHSEQSHRPLMHQEKQEEEHEDPAINLPLNYISHPCMARRQTTFVAVRDDATPSHCSQMKDIDGAKTV